MAQLTWDESGEKIFEAGLDRGVLYLNDGTGLAWNGLKAFNEIDLQGFEPYVYDGLRTGNLPVSGDFAGKLTAFTYPDEFLPYIGISSAVKALNITGLYIPNQLGRRSFGLSYRTLIGDDVKSTDLGYKIHILYNLVASADGIDYETLDDNVDPVDFKWTVTSTPEIVAGYHPTAHVIADSRYLSEIRMAHLEEILYGSETSSPRLPDLASLLDSLDNTYLITITDHGNGTWSAEGPDDLVTMTDETTFSIDSSGVTIIDPDTYDITSA